MYQCLILNAVFQTEKKNLKKGKKQQFTLTPNPAYKSINT